MQAIKGYLTDALGTYFEEISAIPRASRQEERVADHLECFAAKNGLFCYRDAANNVLIKKEGSAGRENEPPLLLQAHTDMVTEVAFGKQHDFSKEGVTLVQKGNILCADGTTLGADDGFGVALMLAALTEAENHPPLECLFTSAEEIGLVGATAFDYHLIAARRMLNFDSAEEHLVITGCCGGIRTDLSMPVQFEKSAATGLEIGVHGLCGGHSGEDIHKGRANALVLMGKLLLALHSVTPIRLARIEGGDKDNAIPRDCVACVIPDDMAAAKRFLESAESILSREVTSHDDAARHLTVCEAPACLAAAYTDTARLLRVLSVKNGVLYERADGKRIPETSRNLASVKSADTGVKFTFSSRSPYDARIDACVDDLEKLAKSVGGTAQHRARYPGWEGDAASPVSLFWCESYRATTGREIDATVLHAGLECGLISARLKGLDVISVGCNIYDLHTPAERMELDSFERIYQTLLAFLQNC